MSLFKHFAMAVLGSSLVMGSALAQGPAAALASETTPKTSAPTADAPAAVEPEYVIGADDVLAVNVWREQEVSRVLPVRPDGMISLPLAGDIQAAGKTAHQLEAEITKRLASYIDHPTVTVIVQEVRSQRVNVVGEVMKPGAYPLHNPTTVIDAIAMAGGFKDFAKQSKIYVLRASAGDAQQKIPVNYKDIIKGKKPEENIVLQPHDTIVVP